MKAVSQKNSDIVLGKLMIVIGVHTTSMLIITNHTTS